MKSLGDFDIQENFASVTCGISHDRDDKYRMDRNVFS